MRVGVDLTSTVRHAAGIGRYAAELARALAAGAPPDERVEAFYLDTAKRRLPPDIERLPATRLARPPRLWRAATALAHATGWAQDRVIGAPDVFIATDHLLPCCRRAATVFALHDLSFRLYPESHQPLNRWYLTALMPRFLRAAGAVVAVSESTRRDAVRLYGLPPESVHLIYEGVHPRFRPVEPEEREAVRRRYTLPERFLLFVGTLEPRKNLVMLIEAFRRAAPGDVHLVIAGQPGWRHQPFLERIRASGPEARVRLLGFAPDDDLPALYSLAEAFVFPSLYEGFGLPALEAMACGTPVLAARSSSLPEVVGDAGLLLPPADADAWAEALRRVTADADLRATLRERGLRQAAHFTWPEAARRMRALYRQLIERDNSDEGR